MNAETPSSVAGPSKSAESSSTSSVESGQAASATAEKENPAAASGTPSAPVKGSEAETIKELAGDTTTEGSAGRRGGAASVSKPSKEPPSARALVSATSSSRRSHVYSMTNSILSAMSKHDLEGIVESVTFTECFGVS